MTPQCTPILRATAAVGALADGCEHRKSGAPSERAPTLPKGRELAAADDAERRPAGSAE